MPSSTFADLGVPPLLCDVLARRGIDTPTPIQAATLPDSLAGRDVLGRGRTGSGKTYAFLLPVIARLTAAGRRPRAGAPRALVLAPTRELAGQIHDSLAPLARAAGLRTLTVFGGVGQNPQVTGLRRGVDVLVACPGRLEDLIGQGHASLRDVEVTVLDEADHMSDLGFLPVVRRLLDATPTGGQRLLFSATLDSGVSTVVARYLSRPVTHEADSARPTVAAMDHHVLHVDVADRLPVLIDLTSAPGRTVVFTRTKHRAKSLARQLSARGVPSVELHGNLGQNARTRNLEAFHSGSAETLVATDIAARGIHVDDVSRVIHADPPVEHKAYVHRSGRTARAGASGTVITLATDEQIRQVGSLTRAAGVRPTTTRVDVAHPLLRDLAPGERVLAAAPPAVSPASTPPASGPGRTQRRSGGSGLPVRGPRPTGSSRRASRGSQAPRRPR